MLKRYFFAIQQTDGSDKSIFVADFKAETLNRAKQEYEEVLGWCGGYEVLKIVERDLDEPVGDDFLASLFVPSGNS